MRRIDHGINWNSNSGSNRQYTDLHELQSERHVHRKPHTIASYISEVRRGRHAWSPLRSKWKAKDLCMHKTYSTTKIIHSSIDMRHSLLHFVIYAGTHDSYNIVSSSSRVHNGYTKLTDRRDSFLIAANNLIKYTTRLEKVFEVQNCPQHWLPQMKDATTEIPRLLPSCMHWFSTYIAYSWLTIKI